MQIKDINGEGTTMTLYDWIFSNYPENSEIDGRWGALHIAVLSACIASIVLIAIFARRSEKARRYTIISLAGAIAFLELARRVINISRGNIANITDFLITVLPRPWCAISCWLLIASLFVNKKFFYNFTSMSGIICAAIFFAYPSVGFNHKYILFENVYSIATHSLLLVFSVSLITLGLTDFRLKVQGERLGVIKEAIMLVTMFIYAFVEIFVLKIEKDPLCFMPGNDVQDVLGVDYPLYLVLYTAFLAVYFSAFYLLQYIVEKHRKT
jgi:hypothetical protein